MPSARSEPAHAPIYGWVSRSQKPQRAEFRASESPDRWACRSQKPTTVRPNRAAELGEVAILYLFRHLVKCFLGNFVTQGVFYAVFVAILTRISQFWSSIYAIPLKNHLDISVARRFTHFSSLLRRFLPKTISMYHFKQESRSDRL